MQQVIFYIFAGLHVLFRLIYVFYIGGILWRRTRMKKDRTQLEEWKRFKTRASFILNLDAETFLAAAIASSTWLPWLSNTSGLREWFHATSFFGLGIPHYYLIGIGVLFIVIGGLTKMDAYRIIGEKGWYWYNFFCPPDESNYEEEGVYKILNNPMYGIGYLPLLGVALLLLSPEGVILSLFDWACIWIFYLLFERPHTVNVLKEEHSTEINEPTS